MDAGTLPAPQSAAPACALTTGGRPADGPVRAGSLIHSGVSLRGYYLMHALGASVPLAAGVLLYGWRAGACVATVLAAAAFALLIWRNIGARGGQIQPAQALWMSLLLGLMLPAHLASDLAIGPDGHHLPGPPWTLLAAGGFGVVMLLWLIGGAGTGRFHVTLCAYLLMFALFAELLAPTRVLARSHLGSGDLLRAQPGQAPAWGDAQPWLERQAIPGFDAFWVPSAAPALTSFTRGDRLGERGRIPMSELLRDRVPPLEDLIIGGQAAPIGCGSAIAVIVGGLFLMYRGLIDFRIPLLVIVFMYAGFLVLPVPTAVTDFGGIFRWVIPTEPDVVWGQAITFANYEMTASPALFMAFFLATAPNIRPLARRARAVYGVLVGVAAAAAQLYVSAAVGPYLALMMIALLAPMLDRWFSSRTLV
jgi:electron transport complex protein RnfD